MHVRKGAGRRADTVFRSWRTTVGVAVACLGLAAICVLAIVTDTAVIAGKIGALVFLAIGAEMAWSGLRRRPDLVITDDAVEHRAFGRIAWSTVDHVRVRRCQSGDAIDLVLTHPDRDYAIATAPSIPMTSLSVPLLKVTEAMREHRPELEIIAA
ncbi:hypothetical protein [Nocardia amikacinitolerans]|uniref:hypothetical protein n=1 Tax=Nocardia amikacinitolerans TaxID=756689 RepID=UPI0020A4FC61|nr:hypothetical protein [Nocardia amikacinitolerans]MCP2276046.1 hypothetical protein [Nocardia amikacinitolerans]MCP2294317.1 hypothetical protein [Nocardia amikacinitolerans]